MIGPITCCTQEMAERLRIAINTDIEKGLFNPARYKKTQPLRLNKYSRGLLEEIKSDISLGTWHGYETALRLYIQPVLGNNFLPDIGHPDLKRLMSHISHLSVSTKQNILGCLHKMMKDAKRDGYLTQLPPWFEFRGKTNPCRHQLSISRWRPKLPWSSTYVFAGRFVKTVGAGLFFDKSPQFSSNSDIYTLSHLDYLLHKILK